MLTHTTALCLKSTASSTNSYVSFFSLLLVSEPLLTLPFFPQCSYNIVFAGITSSEVAPPTVSLPHPIVSTICLCFFTMLSQHHSITFIPQSFSAFLPKCKPFLTCAHAHCSTTNTHTPHLESESAMERLSRMSDAPSSSSHSYIQCTEVPHLPPL